MWCNLLPLESIFTVNKVKPGGLEYGRPESRLRLNLVVPSPETLCVKTQLVQLYHIRRDKSKP